MRVSSCLWCAFAFCGCMGSTVDVGSNDAGSDARPGNTSPGNTSPGNTSPGDMQPGNTSPGTDGDDAGIADGAADNTALSDGAADAAAPVTLTPGIPLAPTQIISDGTTLFWISHVLPGGPISSMPVGGGPITTVFDGMVPGELLGVDDRNVYFMGAAGVVAVPKVGGAPFLVSEATGALGPVASATVFGGNVYWLETQNTNFMPGYPGEVAVKSAPLQGSSIATIADYGVTFFLGFTSIGVTKHTVFVTAETLASFPLASGVPDGGMPTPVTDPFGDAPTQCQFTLSDVDAVYCESFPYVLSNQTPAEVGYTVSRLGDDGTVTLLGRFVVTGLLATSVTTNNGGSFGPNIAFDDRFVYWMQSYPAGAIIAAPKTGGTSVVLAHDTAPIAVAVDTNAVYWSDEAGNVMRLPKPSPGQ